ncbi:MAG: hypothetical protein RL567_381 [Bacteroidota bacterium]|jgi:hypothetical protein
MTVGIDLAALYENEVIYWVTSERPLEQLDQAPVVLEAEVVEVGVPSIATPWLVIGAITEAEKSRLQLIFSAPPLALPQGDWSIIDADQIQVSLEEFVSKTAPSRYIFLGEQSLSGLQANQIQTLGSSKVYYFPRLISTLTDEEKALKMEFWNALKALV